MINKATFIGPTFPAGYLCHHWRLCLVQTPHRHLLQALTSHQVPWMLGMLRAAEPMFYVLSLEEEKDNFSFNLAILTFTTHSPLCTYHKGRLALRLVSSSPGSPRGQRTEAGFEQRSVWQQSPCPPSLHLTPKAPLSQHLVHSEAVSRMIFHIPFHPTIPRLAFPPFPSPTSPWMQANTSKGVLPRKHSCKNDPVIPPLVLTSRIRLQAPRVTTRVFYFIPSFLHSLLNA